MKSEISKYFYYQNQNKAIIYRDGFLEKKMKSRNLLTKNLKPAYQEIEWFLKKANERQKEIMLVKFRDILSGETL